MLAKNWDALGAYRKQDRTRSVELLGFASQLMFTTALLNYSSVLEGGRDPDLAYAVARAHTRHMVDFCSVDRRLLPTGYIPLIDFERTAKAAREAIDLGAKALMIPHAAPTLIRPATLASIHCGLSPRKPACRSCFMSAAAGSFWRTPTSTTACHRSLTSTAATITSSRSTTWPSPIHR